MSKQLIEILITLVVVAAVLWIMSVLIPFLGLPALFTQIVYVIIAVIVVVWLLRKLQSVAP